MKKTFKLGIIFAFIIMLSLTGCGKEESKPNTDNKPSQRQKTNNQTDNDWKDINESNYAKILKSKTDIDLSKLGSVTVTNAYGASTKVAEITGKYENGTTKTGIFEKFIKELLRVSNNSIWSTDVNVNTYKIEKVKEYTDYESFLEWKKNGNEDFSSNLTGGVYIENYSISYTFTDTQFNIHIATYVIN